jgi:hypothetical protein
MADFAQRVRLGQLAEEHRDELGEAGEAFGVPLRLMLGHQALELPAWKLR